MTNVEESIGEIQAATHGHSFYFDVTVPGVGTVRLKAFERSELEHIRKVIVALGDKGQGGTA